MLFIYIFINVHFPFWDVYLCLFILIRIHILLALFAFPVVRDANTLISMCETTKSLQFK